MLASNQRNEPMYEAHEETRPFMDVRNYLRGVVRRRNPTPREKTTSFCGSRVLSRASWRVACRGIICVVLMRARCARPASKGRAISSLCDLNASNRPDPPCECAPARRAGTCHLRRVGRRAQMTQQKCYPTAQITQGADMRQNDAR